MIDTNTVNYALGKMGSAISAAAPTLKDVSESYIRFVVTQEIAHAIIVGIILAVMAAGIAILWIKKPKSGKNEVIDFATLMLSIVLLFLFIVFMVESYDAVMAYMNPAMWTVKEIIEQAKN